MAVTHITTGKNIRSAINYATKGKAHTPNKYIGNQRDLLNLAVNGSSDPLTFTREAEHQLKRAKLYHKNNAQEVRTIISFDPKQLNIKDPNAPLKAGRLAQNIARKVYPHNASYITIQADGEGKNKYHLPIIHAHIITCARRIDNGKSITHMATFRRVQPQVDAIIHESGYKLPPSPYQKAKHNKFKPIRDSKHDTNMKAIKANQRLAHQGKQGWLTSISNALNDAKSQSTSPNQYLHLAYVEGVTVNPFRMRRVKGTKGKNGQYQYKFHIYKSNKTKTGKLRKGHYIKIDNDLITLLSHTGTKNLANNANIASHKGEYLRLSRQIKYSYQGRVIRAGKLGSAYDMPDLERTFIHNAKHDNAYINSLKADATELSQLMQKSVASKSSNSPAMNSFLKSVHNKARATALNDTFDMSKNHKSTSPSLSETASLDPLNPFHHRKMKYYQENLNHKVTVKDLNGSIKQEPLKRFKLSKHNDGTKYVQMLPKPKLVPVKHIHPSSQPVIQALKHVKSLNQRLGEAKKADRLHLIMQRRDAVDEFTAQAQKYIKNVEESQASYEDAKEINAEKLSSYHEKANAYNAQFRQNQRADEQANHREHIKEMRIRARLENEFSR